MQQNEQFKILVIEDEADIRELIVLQLQFKNYMVYSASTGKEAMDMIQSNDYDLFIIDRMLPDSNGLEICKKLRNSTKTSSSPIILLTALAETENIVEGLDAGADDYITKPFDIDILQARVRAQLRKSSPIQSNASDEKVFGKLSINEAKARVKLNGEEIKLTHTEFQILITLASSPGTVHKRRDLIDLIIGDDVHVTNRTIDTHIAGLRKKLAPESSLIETIRGIGYRLQDNEQ
ncbi:MAG: response regulator transcription factor [Bacteriovoracaceae bacterium]|nr:response regulator transcription factor [Bacteriovoracaceae bacterium]